jgi:hypothetical protein
MSLSLVHEELCVAPSFNEPFKILYTLFKEVTAISSTASAEIRGTIIRRNERGAKRLCRLGGSIVSYDPARGKLPQHFSKT